MQSEFLEIGQIVNTHGIRGEVKLVPWADSPEFVCQFNTLYADGAPLKVTSARVHKGNVIAKLEGVDDVNAAMLLKGKTVHIRRSNAPSCRRQLFPGRPYRPGCGGRTWTEAGRAPGGPLPFPSAGICGGRRP